MCSAIKSLRPEIVVYSIEDCTAIGTAQTGYSQTSVVQFHPFLIPPTFPSPLPAIQFTNHSAGLVSSSLQLCHDTERD